MATARRGRRGVCTVRARRIHWGLGRRKEIHMKRILGLVIGVALLGCVAMPAADKPPAPKQAEPAPADPVLAKGSYCLGLRLGRDVQKQKLDLQIDRFLKGMRDGMAGVEVKMTDAEIEKAIAAFQDQRRRRLAKENLEKGKAFLARTRKIEGVTVTKSGLQYLVIRPGTGQRPKITDTVVVHYRGSLIDNTVFDSSIARRQAETLPVAGVIPGWTEALQLMRAGAKWKLFVPPNLGYGKEGSGDAIGPNATLIFEVELIQIRIPPPKP